jgi:hypothetical protein
MAFDRKKKQLPITPIFGAFPENYAVRAERIRDKVCHS